MENAAAAAAAFSAHGACPACGCAYEECECDERVVVFDDQAVEEVTNKPRHGPTTRARRAGLAVIWNLMKGGERFRQHGSLLPAGTAVRATRDFDAIDLDAGNDVTVSRGSFGVVIAPGYYLGANSRVVWPTVQWLKLEDTDCYGPQTAVEPDQVMARIRIQDRVELVSWWVNR